MKLKHANTLKRSNRFESNRELAERAGRADAVIATVSLIGLVVLLIVQLAEKGIL